MQPCSHTMVCLTHIGLGDKGAENETLESHEQNHSNAPAPNVLSVAHNSFLERQVAFDFSPLLSQACMSLVWATGTIPTLLISDSASLLEISKIKSVDPYMQLTCMQIQRMKPKAQEGGDGWNDVPAYSRSLLPTDK